MPRPAHLMIVHKGVFGTAAAPAEVWQFGLRADTSILALTQAARNTLAEGVKTAYAVNLAPQINGNAVLTDIELRQIDAAGLEPKDAGGAYSGQGRWTGVVAGGGGSFVYPLQTATVVSLTTARAGASGKGRCFIPLVNGVLGGDFRTTSATATGLMDAFRNYVVELNTTVLAGPCVVASTKGFLSPITGFRVGRVPDTQRSRTGAMQEGYSTRGIAAQ